MFFDPSVRTVIWPGALSWMGVACLLNAKRCGRLHCFLTGPFFLCIAALSLLHGLDVLSLGDNGWGWLVVVLIAGGWGLLWKLPEYLWGSYVERKSTVQD